MHRYMTVISRLGNTSVKFNQRGTRLLCHEFGHLSFPKVYDVATSQQMASNGVESSRRVEFSAPGYATPYGGRNNFCFAGQDDELVVAASFYTNLFVWSLPFDQELSEYQVIDQPLVALEGHEDQIYSVRYNRQRDTLASAGEEKVITLWTPIDHP